MKLTSLIKKKFRIRNKLKKVSNIDRYRLTKNGQQKKAGEKNIVIK